MLTVSSQINAGFGLADITPDRPLSLAGIDGTRLGKETLDSLNVRALLVSHGDDRLVLVAIDALYVSRGLCAQLERWLERYHGIPGVNLFVAATHTHCAPLLLDTYCGGVELHRSYVDLVVEKTRLAITAAFNSLRPVTVTYATPSAPISVNRRAIRLDRTSLRRGRLVRTMVNRPNHHAPVDNLVRCIRFEALKPEATDIVLLSAGCHPSIIRSEVYSADFPGLIERQLEKFVDRPTRVMFVQGFSGDTRARLLETARFAMWPPGRTLEWLFDRHRFRKNSLHEDAEWVAREIACAVARARLATLTAPRLSAATSEVRLALDSLTLKDGFSREPESSNGVTLQMRAWSLADNVRLLGLEGEIFSEYALWLSKILQGKGGLTMPVSCVGGMVGYIPTAAALAGGGYEIDRSRPLFGLSSRFAYSVERTVKDGLRALVSV